MMLLDPRLSLALKLYRHCRLAADIGTDHAYLPAALLLSGRCEHMIITDRSASALLRAKATISAFELEDRVSIRRGNGLDTISEHCSMISIMGMGGKNIADIIRHGISQLKGAELLLSCHSDLTEMRRGIMEVGYHITVEEPCRSNGRYYLLIKAEEGRQPLTEQQMRTGVLLLSSSSPELKGYLIRQRNILSDALAGAVNASVISDSKILNMENDLVYYNKILSVFPRT